MWGHGYQNSTANVRSQSFVHISRRVLGAGRSMRAASRRIPVHLWHIRDDGESLGGGGRVLRPNWGAVQLEDLGQLACSQVLRVWGHRAKWRLHAAREQRARSKGVCRWWWEVPTIRGWVLGVNHPQPVQERESKRIMKVVSYLPFK